MHALAAVGYLVYSLDTRGHGDSDWAEDGDYSFDALCADLWAMLNSLRGKPDRSVSNEKMASALLTTDRPGACNALIGGMVITTLADVCVASDRTTFRAPEFA